MKRTIVTTFLFCFINTLIIGQDLSGFWKGTFRMQGCFSSNNIELQLNFKDGIASGDSYHYQDVDNYVKKNLTATYDPSSQRLMVQEGIVTTVHIPQRCVVCIKEFNLVYSKTGNVETLKGLWSGNVENTNMACGVDSIVLTRIKESAFKEIPEIKVDTGMIRLDFYDNATIDGDSITVKINNIVVLSHQLLTAKPVTTFVHVDARQPFHEVEMIAENLGSIPPNTAMLIITAGETRRLLSLSSSEAKSARIRIVYEGTARRTPEPPIFSTR